MFHLLTLVVVILWFLGKLNRWQWAPIPRWPAILLGGYLLLSFVSMGFSIQPFQSYLSAMIIVNGLLLFYLAMDLIQSQAQRKGLVFALMAGAGVIAGFGVYQGVWGFNQAVKHLMEASASPVAVEMARNQQRVFATFINSNALAGYLLMAFPLVFYGARQLQWGWSKKAGELGAVLCVVALLMTFSKGGWLSFALMLALYAVLIMKEAEGWAHLKRLSVLLLAGLICFALLQPISTRARQGSTVLAQHETVTKWVPTSSWNVSAEGRLAYWRSAIGIIQDHPLTGTGLGTFATAVQPYQVGMHYSRYAHNHALHLASEIGLPGATVYLAFLALMVWIAVNRVRRHPLGAALLAGLVGFILHGLIDFTGEIPAIQLNAMLFSGLILGLRRESEALTANSQGTHLPIFRTALLAGSASLAVVLLMMLVIRPWLAEAYLASALEASKLDRVDKAIELGKEAVRLAPGSGRYTNFLASALRRKGDLTGEVGWYQKSLSQADRAVDLEPRVALYHAERAQTLWALNDRKRALEDLRRARALYPANPAYANALARVFIKVRAYDLALKELQAVHKMQGAYLEDGYWDMIHFFDAHFLRAELYRRTDQDHKAIAAYQDAVSLAEKSPPLLSLNRKDLDKMASTDKIAAHAHYLMGQTLYEMGRDQEAMTHYQLAIQKDPTLEVAGLGQEGVQ